MCAKKEEKMNKLLISSMALALFALETQESSAREVTKVKSVNNFLSIRTDELVKGKGLFSKKNKALTKAVSELKKLSEILKNDIPISK